MNAKDIMTTPVITIAPDTQVREIVALLIEKRISGVLVAENERVVGIVNEGDLLHRYEIGTDGGAPDRSWWARLIRPDRNSVAYVKSHAGRAQDIMTRHVVSITEDTSLRQIALILEARHIRRVPVLRGNQMVGIVTRADLIRALAQKTQALEQPHAQTDEGIRRRLLAELEKQRWWRPDWSAVDVRDGIVSYRGLLESEDERNAARVAAENVPGVRAVEDNRMPWAAWQAMT